MHSQSPNAARRALAFVVHWTRSVVVAFLLFMGVRAFLIEAFKIPTGSMEGTLMVGDFLLVNKLVYGAQVPGTDLHLPPLSEPGRGDVIVFNPPHDMSRNYVKRVVGVPGDTLEMRDKQLFVNGQPLDEPYVRTFDCDSDQRHPKMDWQAGHLVAATRGRYRPTRDTWGPLVVPDSAFFVLGDNRDNSEDSRYWGFVGRENIRGRPWRVYYSFDRAPVEGRGWLAGVRWNRIGELVE